MTAEGPTGRMVAWYATRVRPRLQTYTPTQLAPLDLRIAAAEDDRSEPEPVRVGVLGESGVGKSSLINALVSRRLGLLPQGGVGPLTAGPIEVRYAADPYLRVACFGRERVEALVRALRTRASVPELDKGTRDAILVERRMAMLLATGGQFGSMQIAGVLAFLQTCLSERGTESLSPDAAARALAVREVLAVAAECDAHIQIDAGGDLPGLLRRIAAHAAGFLAPLTASIEIGWDTPLLHNGVVLVDLPGLGVAHDLYRPATAAQLARLDVLLLVTDRAGLTQATVDLLDASGAFERITSPTSFAKPLALIVAVTKLDQPATELVASARAQGARLAWPEAYAQCAQRAREVLRAQVDTALARAGVGHLYAAPVPVFPVFPREYQRFHRRDPDEPSRLAEVDAAGMDALAAHLLEVRYLQHSDALQACERALALLAPHLAHEEVAQLHRELRELRGGR